MLVPFIKSLVVLDADGDRLFAKYYDGRKKPEQITNEATLFKKTKTVTAKSEGSSTCNSHSFVLHSLNVTRLHHFFLSAEVLLLDNEIIVYRSGIECKFFISGPIEEVGSLFLLITFTH